MKKNTLVAQTREASTKGAARQLRRNGMIPAVLYGEGQPQPLSIDSKTWLTQFRHFSGNTILDLKVGTTDHKVLIKDTQEDLITDKVKHIDFYAIHAGQKLNTEIPIHLEGTPKGIIEGGIMEQKLDSLEVTCLPKDMPEVITLNIADLEIGDSIHVGAIPEMPGVEIRTEPTVTVVVVGLPKAAPVEEEEEGEEVAEGVDAVDEDDEDETQE